MWWCDQLNGLYCAVLPLFKGCFNVEECCKEILLFCAKLDYKTIMLTVKLLHGKTIFANVVI